MENSTEAKNQASEYSVASALAYARRGWRVFPTHWITSNGICTCRREKCSSAGKHPLTPNGCKDATCDEVQIHKWFSRWPHANVAIATGHESGLAVLDVDPRHEGDFSLHELERLYGKLPETVCAITGGRGQHYFFRHPGGEFRNKARIRDGLDIRGDGGYVVAAPSNHASGGTYCWEAGFGPDEAKLADMPAWLVGIARGPSISPTCAKVTGALVPEGGRNNHLASLAGKLRRSGVDRETILAALIAENSTKCSPPLDRQEVERIADSILRYEPGSAAISRPTIPREIFSGLAGEIIAMIDPHTEASPVAILGQLLVAFGNVIGRNAYYQVEATRHYPNFFLLLIGNTAKGRKGTSWQHIRALFSAVAPDWELNCIANGLSSGEGVIFTVRDSESRVGGDEKKALDPGVSDKRLLIVESEFAKVLRTTRRESNTLSAIIRDAWDGGYLRTLTKQSPLKATGAHISIVGHGTKDELTRYLGYEEAFNGFGNRFLFLLVERSKLLPEGGNISEVDFSDIHRRLRQAIEFAKAPSRITFSESARRLWCKTYEDLSAELPGMIGAMTARGEAQVSRLATLYALLASSNFIEVEHLESALALWRYSEASCGYIFGSQVGSRTGEQIRKALAAAGPQGISRTDIRNLFNRNKSQEEIEETLKKLLSRGIACSRMVNTDGRPAERWWLAEYYDQTTEGGAMN